MHFLFFALKGQSIPAQGNALGIMYVLSVALKVRSIFPFSLYGSPLQGYQCQFLLTQGCTLG